MKKVLLLLSMFVTVSIGCVSGQSFFKDIPPPTFSKETKLTASLKGISLDSIVKSIRPVAVISGVTSSGVQLAGGAGIGYQSNKWDAGSQSYVTQYSISLVGLLGTNGAKITGTGGLVIGVPGTNGLIGVGGGRDFTLGAWVLITGVQIKFN